MDRKATQKNFYREIRKSPGRFLSIFFIVAMGVAFFSGIRASEPSMRITGDAYFDGADLMDLEVISTLGITEDDIEAFEEIEGVELAEGSYSSDFLCDTEDRQYVFHVMSLTDKVNQPDVLEGRMPEKVGECLMDADMGYKVGDTVTLKSGTGDPLEDTLKTDTYEIVGLASSPCYVSFERGSATIGSGSISGFMLVPSKTFAMETYSEAYIKVAGAADEIAYTDAYEDKVQKVSDRIEEITGERGRIRKQEILADAQEEIDEGRKELEDGRAEADQELSDAAAQIADGEKQLADAKVQLEDGRKQLEDGKAQLTASQKEIDNARSQYESGLSQWKAGQAEYESGLAEYEARKPGAEAQIQQGEEALAASRQQLDEGSIDFAILEGDYSRAAYSHIPFLTDQFVPICSSSHPFANTRRALSLTDLTGETLLIREPGSGTRSILEQALNSHDLAPSDFANLITIGNMNAIKEMTAAGAGITFLYETAVKSELKNGTIQKIPITKIGERPPEEWLLGILVLLHPLGKSLRTYLFITIRFCYTC